MTHTPSISPEEARERLIEGNKRYCEEELTHCTQITHSRREELISGQAPYAAVLTCSDSRTPPEHIFDAGLGDLFVCRNAGNLIDEVTLGSIEYAAAHTGCPMVCVLGHNNCGAVGAAVAAAKDPDHFESHNVDDIVRRLLSAVIATRDGQESDQAWIDAAARKNVVNVCRNILQRSSLLRRMVNQGVFDIAGAWYDLGSGKVDIITKIRKYSEIEEERTT